MILNNAETFKETIKESKITVVDFYADWCGPCKMLAPIFEKIANNYNNEANFIKVNVDNFSEIAAEYNIQSIPTIIYFKNGIEIERTLGMTSEDAIINKIKSL